MFYSFVKHVSSLNSIHFRQLERLVRTVLIFIHFPGNVENASGGLLKNDSKIVKDFCDFWDFRYSEQRGEI